MLYALVSELVKEYPRMQSIVTCSYEVQCCIEARFTYHAQVRTDPGGCLSRGTFRIGAL